MHRNHTSRLIRRAVIVAMLAAAVAIGALSPGRAEAATSPETGSTVEPTAADASDTLDRSILLADDRRSAEFHVTDS